MQSSWYSRRRIETLGTSSGAVAGATLSNDRTMVVGTRVARDLRLANKARGVRCMPHVA